MAKENFIQEAIRTAKEDRRVARPGKTEPKLLNAVHQLYKDRGIKEKDLR